MLKSGLKSSLNPKLIRFINARRWEFAGLLLSLIALVTITFSFLTDAVYFNDPRHKNVELEAWMTPRYISLSYELPRPMVLDLLGLEEGTNFPKRLDRLSENLGFTLEELTLKVRDLKTNYVESDND